MRLVQQLRLAGSHLRPSAFAGPVAVAVAAVLLFAASANAAPLASSTRSAAGSLCSVSKTVALNIVHSTSLVGPSSTPTYLKTVYGKIQAAEPTILGAASGSLKTDFHDVFGFVNTLIADLKQANWNVVGLAPHEKALMAAAAKVTPQLAALKRYYDTTCKFNA